MPTTALKHFAKKSGHKLADVERKWEHAKKIVKDQYDKSEDDTSFWALTTGVLKKMLGLKESKSFKEFMNEHAADPEKLPQFSTIDEYDAIKIFFTHCKDARWMLEKNTPLYRGDSTVNLPGGFATIDTTATSRVSKITSNYYTLIFDNVLDDSFPKRSKSFIATNNKNTADGYAKNAEPFVIIPYDGVKIGIVNSEDMWDIEISLFNIDIDVAHFNAAWRDMPSLSEHYWSTWEDFDKRLADDDEDAQKEFENGLRTIDHSGPTSRRSTDFLKKIKAAYSAKATGFKSATTSTLYYNLPDHETEVWIGGECLIVSLSMWEKMVRDHENNSQ
jgi:hypothetical protein